MPYYVPYQKIFHLVLVHAVSMFHFLYNRLIITKHLHNFYRTKKMFVQSRIVVGHVFAHMLNKQNVVLNHAHSSV